MISLLTGGYSTFTFSKNVQDYPFADRLIAFTPCFSHISLLQPSSTFGWKEFLASLDFSRFCHHFTSSSNSARPLLLEPHLLIDVLRQRSQSPSETPRKVLQDKFPRGSPDLLEVLRFVKMDTFNSIRRS